MTVTTHIVKRFKGFTKRAVYLNGKHVGYTVSHLKLHTGILADGTKVTPANGDVGWELMREAVAAVGTAAQAARDAL